MIVIRNKSGIAFVLQLILGGVFVFSAISKLASLGLTEIILIDQGITDSRQFAAYLARILIGFEFALGLLLMQRNYLKSIVLPVAGGTLIIFSVHLVRLIFLGNSDNCGCLGDLISMTPAESLIKNIILLIPIGFLFFAANPKPGKPAIPLSAVILSFAVTFLIAPIKSTDGFPFTKYTHFENAGRVDLSSGEKLLAVINLDCEHCREAAAEIGKLQRSGADIPEVLALFFREDTTTVQTFNNLTETNFPYDFINSEKFFNLIGSSPPRVYFLKDGQIKTFWDENFSENLESTFK